MIDHLGFDVRDYEASKRFYQEALAPLGYELLVEFDGAWRASAGRASRTSGSRPVASPRRGIHVAFVSSDRETVDRVHEAALAAGGTDNGPPGPRPLYHEHYYGPYVLDPDGNNVEAVCHAPDA